MKQKIKYFLLSALLLGGMEGAAQSPAVWKLKDLKKALNDTGPTIINFWATFCKPCIAELPHFESLASKYKNQGVKLVLVSLDLKEAYPKKINAFTKKLHLASSIVFLDESNADIFCPVVDSSWSGAIPATIFVNGRTGYKKFFEEELSKEKLETEIKLMLESQRRK